METSLNRSQEGAKMPDGTIYVGKVNGRQVFAAPEDAKDSDGQTLLRTFNGAAAYADKLNRENYLDHNDWHVPTEEEMKLICENRDSGGLSKNFNTEGAFP